MLGIRSPGGCAKIDRDGGSAVVQARDQGAGVGRPAGLSGGERDHATAR